MGLPQLSVLLLLFFAWSIKTLEKAMAPHCSTLAWKVPWMEEPGRLRVHGVAKSQTQLSDFTFTFSFHALEKETAAHSSVLAWRTPGTGEPVGPPSMGSHRVRHDWSDLAAAAARKTTRPFRFDLNQIPYDYTVEVRNRFKGLDLIDRVPEELWMEVHNTKQEAGIGPSPRKQNARRQNDCLKRPYK